MSEMVPFKLLISREEALKRIMDSVKPIEKVEPVPIEEASGRVITEDVTVQEDVPPFDREIGRAHV